MVGMRTAGVTRSRAAARLAAIATGATIAALGVTGPLAAQGVEPIRLTRTTQAGSGSCASVAARPAPARADTSAARRLAESGADAALLGDVGAAREQFERAAALNPRAPDITYQLARLHEEAGDGAAARRELCRYLTLAPSAADSSDATRRLAALGDDTPRAPNENADVQYRTGVAYAARSDFASAARSFAAAGVAAPDWSDAHVGHAAALVAMGNHAAAMVPLRRAYALRPDPADRAMTERQLRVLERARLSPTNALALGVIPGGGQFYGDRPFLGALVLATAAGGGVLTVLGEDVLRTFVATDANGFEYEYVLEVREYPQRNLGIGIAAGATLLGAIEAFAHASRARGAAERLTRGTAAALRAPAEASVAPWTNGRDLGIAVRIDW